MNENKQKIIKSGALLVATTIVLVVVTVAWFISGAGQASVEGIRADIVSDGFTYLLYEAIDDNKNGILDASEAAADKWLPVPALDINIDKAVPNQYRFFKATVQLGARTQIKATFDGIVVIPPNSPLTQQEFLELIKVEFRTEDANGQLIPEPGPGVDPFNKNMYEILGDPVPQKLDVYTVDLTDRPNETFNVYYTIGIDGDLFTQVGDFTGGLVEIDEVVFE